MVFTDVIINKQSMQSEKKNTEAFRLRKEKDLDSFVSGCTFDPRSFTSLITLLRRSAAPAT